jgi:hypothetical protein
MGCCDERELFFLFNLKYGIVVLMQAFRHVVLSFDNELLIDWIGSVVV